MLKIGFQRPSGFESCIQQRKTTCLLSIRKSLAGARASKLPTTNMHGLVHACMDALIQVYKFMFHYKYAICHDVESESESKYCIDESIPTRVTHQSKHPQSVMHVQFYNQISMIRLLFIAYNQTQLPNTPKII